MMEENKKKKTVVPDSPYRIIYCFNFCRSIDSSRTGRTIFKINL